MIWWVSAVSLVLSVLSFLLFAINVLFPPPRDAASAKAANVEGWARLAEAIAKVIDSLNKAGPAVLTLVSAIVFMIIAFMGAKM